MIAQESSMGMVVLGQNGKRDIMQTLYEYDGAIYTLFKMRFGENYNKTYSDYVQHVFEYYKNGRSNEGLDSFENIIGRAI